MLLEVSERCVFGRVGVTVEATLETGVVGADVNTFDTATNLSLVFIFLCGNRVACESFY